MCVCVCVCVCVWYVIVIFILSAISLLKIIICITNNDPCQNCFCLYTSSVVITEQGRAGCEKLWWGCPRHVYRRSGCVIDAVLAGSTVVGPGGGTIASPGGGNWGVGRKTGDCHLAMERWKNGKQETSQYPQEKLPGDMAWMNIVKHTVCLPI